MKYLWQKSKNKTVRFPISLKLMAVTTFLLLTVTYLIASQSSVFFQKEVKATHEQSNQTRASNHATQIEVLIQSYLDRIRMIATVMTKNFENPTEKKEMIDLIFKTEKDIVAVDVYEMKDQEYKSIQHFINTDHLKLYNLSEEYFPHLQSTRPFPIKIVFSGKIEVANSSLPSGMPLLSIGIPFIKDDFDNVSHIAIAYIKLEKIQKIFSTPSAAEIFLVDKEGIVLAHPNDKFSLESQSLSDNPLVNLAINSTFRSNHLPSFVNPSDSRTYYGVFNRTSFGISVIAQIREDIILEPAKQVQREAYFVGGLVISITLSIIFLFSVSLTGPLEKLLEITYEVAKGNFNVGARNKIKSRDEVGDLASAFDKMTMGLKALVKTQGADVAHTLMETDLDTLGGTKKNVSVLFSDLRDFTKFSEGHSPEEVVSMLNEYFEVMVACIERNEGRVNKFIGDAIMAMWGAPTSTGRDEENAIRAALEMRVELNKLNELRINRAEPPIKIGVGLHCGEAVAGTIGSKSRLEYTIIGDTVNQASRLEASTKAFGVDIILSEEMKRKIDNIFLIDLIGTAEVKGKSEPLKMYKINGFKNENGSDTIIKTPYSEYKAEATDKIKVAS